MIFRIDALGDTILSTPLICQLRQGFPDAEICVVASVKGFPALEGMREINDIVVIDLQKLNFQNLLSLALDFSHKRIDVSINISEKMWGYLIPYLARIPVRIGFWPGYTQPIKSILCSCLLTHRVYYPNNPLCVTGEHEVERHSRLLIPLGINEKPGPLHLSIDDESRFWVSEYLKGKRSPSYPNLVAVHLSQKWLQDSWDIGVLESIIDGILRRNDTQILITYSEFEKNLAEKLLEQKQNNQKIIPFFHPSFKRWAAALQYSRLLITMDTSASHVASAIGIPVIDVFPEKYFAHTTYRWFPWRVEYRLVEKRSLSNIADPEERSRIKREFNEKILQYLEELIKK